MSSFLSFAWRNNSSTTNNNNGKTASASAKNSATIPDVTHSASLEDVLSPTASVENENQQPQSKQQNKKKAPPGTPEGLKQRKPFREIRRQLGVSSKVLKKYKQQKPDPKTTIAAATATTALPLLPPHPVVHSPQVTNSSFYSRESSSTKSTRVAVSPNLAAPTTAVGALVAASTHHTHHNNRAPAPVYHKPLLPPRHWLDDDDQQEHAAVQQRSQQYGQQQPQYQQPQQYLQRQFYQQQEQQYQQQFNNHMPPMRPLRQHHDLAYQRMEVENNNNMMMMQYCQLEDEDDDEQSSRDNSEDSDDGDDLYNINANVRWQPPQDSSITSSSFGASSQAGLVEDNQQRRANGYNFDPILHLNVSAISGPADDQSSLHSLEAYQHTMIQHQSMEEDMAAEEEEEDRDTWMMKRKRWNQRSHKERLVLDCMERLMADLDLVADIEAQTDEGTRSTSDWFLQTPMNEEGLLVGLEVSTKQRLQRYLQSIINEMDTACPEEFFLSPTQMDAYGDTHQDLKQALQFVLSIAGLNSMEGENNEWQIKYEVRTAMGLSSQADSPETVRGGDTSLFSLPEESMTPHTSNVSMATTITSRPSSPTPPHHHQANKDDAVAVRKTVEILSTILQRLSLSVKRLLETGRASSPEAIRATEEMKRHYLQLMQLKNADLAAVSESFFQSGFAGFDMPLIRTVSLEEQEHQAVMAPPCVIQQPEPRHLLGAFDADMHTTILPEMTTTKGISHRIEEEEEEDDLRRIVGSNDYDCNDRRDGPDDCERDDEIRDFYYQEPCRA